MPSKSKAQRAFLIKVVADEEFAKSRKMSQDVARGILDEDEEEIAKDKHWADKLPDRANGASMESRVGDKWYNPEYIDLLVEQQVHPSFESFRETLRNAARFLLGKGTSNSSTSNSKYTPPDMSHYNVLSNKPEDARQVKTGTGDFSAYATAFHLKSTPTPFWNGLIRLVEQYEKDVLKLTQTIRTYCKKCEAIYDKCETMPPKAARAYAETEMRKIGLSAPAKSPLPMADFEIHVGPRGGTSYSKVVGQPQRVVTEYPTQAQYEKLVALLDKLWTATDDNDIDFWTLDDTDEVKWWDHHFPGESEDWGPMLDLFPFAGEIRGFDSSGLSWSHDTVCDTLARLLTAVSQPKSE